MNYPYNYYQNYGAYQPTYQSQQMAQPQIMQNQQQTTTQYDKAIQDVRFVSQQEAHDYILLPNTRVMLIDRDNSVFYIKSADSLGKSTLEGYKYTRIDNYANDGGTTVLDPKEFVKIKDLDKYLTKEDLSNFLTRTDAQNFITKDDLKSIDSKLEKLQKQIVGDMTKGDFRTGKQLNN